jgi:hypothetical protein
MICFNQPKEHACKKTLPGVHSARPLGVLSSPVELPASVPAAPARWKKAGAMGAETHLKSSQSILAQTQFCLMHSETNF